MKRALYTTLLLLIFPVLLRAQSTKRSLTHADYDRWQTARAEKLSHDGRWVAFQVDPQEGDGTLHISRDGKPAYRFPRGYQASFTADSRFLIAKLKAPYAATRQAKLKKKKADELPKDSLLVLNLATGVASRFPNVKSYTLGKNGGGWVAILQERNEQQSPPARPIAQKDEADSEGDTTKPAPKAAAPKVAAKKPKGDDLILLSLADGSQQRLRYVTGVQVSDNGRTVFFSRESHSDSLKVGEIPKPGVYAFDTRLARVSVIDTNAKYKLYKGLAVDTSGTRLAWMASADSVGAEVRVFSLFYKNLAPTPVKSGRKAAPAPVVSTLLVDTLSPGLPKGWAVNEYGSPRFSEDGQRLYLTTAPLAQRAIKDTLTPEDEKVKLDIWTWTDRRLQPMQQRRLKEEKERGYLAVVDLATPAAGRAGTLVQLANPDVPSVTATYRRNLRYLLGRSDVPYQVMSSWDPGHADLYLVDARTGAKTKIAADVQADEVRLSPGGQYAFWFDQRDTVWRAWSVVEGKRIDLTRGLPVKFQDEEHDTPDLPASYGAAGWTTGDRYLWIYDRYDLWQLDPTGREKPLNLTGGFGRTNKVRLRRAELDRSDELQNENGINPAETLYLTGFWEQTKQTGILKAPVARAGARPVAELSRSNHRYSGLSKARDASTLTFYRGNFTESVNLFQTDTTLARPVALSRTNPQQDSVRWGNVELVNWTGTNGLKLEGLLYKPEGFDPARKYPMLVYFYERNAETLYDYKAPAPSRSIINIAYCVSNGYLVFVPDIVYTTGQPGPNAYDCVVPGVLSLIDRGFVDRDRIGIQGQSWGGYQTAYIITRTNLFRAAGAGAPVANMTSAYGGIRWETGMSRMFQYEKTQSRIGGTLWEKPMNYLENSPLFTADRIRTPLFMTHNDADGAVPWYQGIELFTALRRLNKPVWMLVYNGEGHNLTQRHNAKDLSIRMYQFFDHYLKDAPIPTWMKDGRTALEKERGEMKY